MALTPFRWAALAIIGSLVALTTLLEPPPEPRRQDARWALVARVRALNSSARRAADGIRMLQVRDSVLPLLARMPATDSSRVVFDRAAAPWGNMLRQLVASTAPHRPDRSRIPTDVVFVLDTVSQVAGTQRGVRPTFVADYLLPSSPDDRCVAIVRLNPQGDRLNSLRHREYAQRLLGPCAFFEAFGMPGPHVDRWLLAGGWNFGRHATWLGGPSPWNGPSWAFDRNELNWGARYWTSTAGFRCITGDATTCEEILTTPPPTRREVLSIPRLRLVAVTTLAEWSGYRQRPLGLLEARVLGEMVANLGPDRFGKFWSSAAPVPEAFRTAAGVGLGEWTAAWSVRAYGPLRRGPEVPGSAAVFALGLVAMSAAGAGFAARRRQVR